MHLIFRLVSVIAVFIGSSLITKVPVVQKAGMKFFRDLGRVKARRRLMAGHNSLAVYKQVFFEINEEELNLAETDITVEFEELESANGVNDTPLWISLKGRVYDVSAGHRFYGIGKPYYSFVGRDASRAFCTGCMEPECLISSLDGLTKSQLLEADRWLEFFEFHDKYKFVGTLVHTNANIDALVEVAMETEAVGDYEPPQVPIIPTNPR